jgi:DNA polymerase-3 subunit alpha
MGQGSIFDFDEPAGGGAGGSAFALPSHPPVPPVPDDPKLRNEMEKETLGLFLSSHPLKEVRPALRAKVDCSLADAADRKDGEWVTVGGMIVECKRIRTKKGDMMMFATLDDLEGQVEILVFNSAYQGNADKIDVDKLVIVRGRIDHKEQGETKVVVQDVQPFEPTEAEVEKAREKFAEVDAKALLPPPRLVLRVAPEVPATFLDELHGVVTKYKGDQELELIVGERSVVLGGDFRVCGSAQCIQDLRHALDGAAELVPVVAAPEAVA